MTVENTIHNPDFVDWGEKVITQFLLCRSIIQAFNLFEIMRTTFPCRNDSEFLVLLDHMAYDYIIVNWAKMFGSKEEDLHFRKVFKYDFYQNGLVVANFLTKLALSETDYKQMHTKLLEWRDKIIAHFDFYDAYEIQHNEDFFQKIPIQCQALQFSIIDALRAAGEQHPTQEIYIKKIDAKKKFSEVADNLSKVQRVFPLGITEGIIVNMFDIYKKHKQRL